MIERVHLKFCKLLLHLKSSTPNFMIYGETGRMPLYIQIKSRILNYWANLMCGKQSKYSTIILQLLMQKQGKGIECGWTRNLKSILDRCGGSYILYEGVTRSNKSFMCNTIKQNLSDQFQQEWSEKCNTSNKGIIYRLFTGDEFKKQSYLYSTMSSNIIRNLVRYRCANHHLPIEVGRWLKLERPERICNLCNNNQVGDEYHYILECKYFKVQRSLYLHKKYTDRPNTLKFNSLFSTKNTTTLIKLSKFISVINKGISDR